MTIEELARLKSEEALEKRFVFEVRNAALRATQFHGNFNSAHEAFAVLLEEVDELWDEVRKKRENRDSVAMWNELVQIAACCLKTAYCPIGKGALGELMRRERSAK